MNIHPRNKPFLCEYCISQLTQMWLINNNFPHEVELAIQNRKCQMCGRDLIAIENLKILGPYILVEPKEPDVICRGVIRPGTAWKFWNIGVVLKLGEKASYSCYKLNQRREPVGKLRYFTRPEVSEGDIVMFEKMSPKRVEICGKRLCFVHYDDVALQVLDITQIVPT